jgi:hypothetical protein
MSLLNAVSSLSFSFLLSLCTGVSSPEQKDHSRVLTVSKTWLTASTTFDNARDQPEYSLSVQKRKRPGGNENVAQDVKTADVLDCSSKVNKHTPVLNVERNSSDKKNLL